MWGNYQDENLSEIKPPLFFIILTLTLNHQIIEPILSLYWLSMHVYNSFLEHFLYHNKVQNMEKRSSILYWTKDWNIFSLYCYCMKSQKVVYHVVSQKLGRTLNQTYPWDSSIPSNSRHFIATFRLRWCSNSIGTVPFAIPLFTFIWNCTCRLCSLGMPYTTIYIVQLCKDGGSGGAPDFGSSVKVQLCWEGHKNLRTFCGLLRKAEL